MCVRLCACVLARLPAEEPLRKDSQGSSLLVSVLVAVWCARILHKLGLAVLIDL